MHAKVVCPTCGEICKTGSIRNFRHCGLEYSVKENLLSGEEEKFKKLVEKRTGKPTKAVKPVKDEKPVEKIVEKVEAKQAEKPVVAPIIEEKPEPPEEKKVQKKKKKKKKSEIEEKIVKEDVVEVSNFGFF